MSPTHRFGADGDSNFQVLWEDGDRVFCRAWRPGADGSRHAVLAVLPAAEHPAPATLDRLAHEYALRDELDGTWAVRPLALVRDPGRTMLVLEDPGSQPLARRLGAPMAMEDFLPLAIAIAGALAQVHRRGLVHKDIKPQNILVHPANGEIKLTGFGIASRLPRERQAPEPPESIAGTLAYMAPEQTGRMNRSINSRSDLYALGVTFYQMLTGALPFTAVRADGVGALPYRAATGRPRRAGADNSGPRLGDRHEAARQDGRGPLPDRFRPGERPAALPGGMAGAASD